MIPNAAKMANNCSNLLEILYSKPFNAAGNKNKGGMDFSKLLPSDGSPHGGSIESGNADTGWSNAAYM